MGSTECPHITQALELPQFNVEALRSVELPGDRKYSRRVSPRSHESSRSSRHVVVCVLVPSPPVVVVNARVAVKPSSLMDVVTVVVSVASVDVVVVVVVMVESDGLANGLAGGERDLGGLAEALRLRSMALRLGTARTCPWTRNCFGAIREATEGLAAPGTFTVAPNMDAVVAVFALDMLWLLLLLLCSCSWHGGSCVCRQTKC